MLRRLLTTVVITFTAAAVVASGAPAFAASPYGGPVGANDPYAYQNYMRITPAQYPPNEFGDPGTTGKDGNGWMYSSKSACALYGMFDPQHPCTPKELLNEQSAQELHNVTGASVDKAWETTTGRPDVVIGNVDSGMMWNDPGAINDLNNKYFLNTGELPEPDWGTRDPAHPFDRDHNGQVDMRDWCPDWTDEVDCGGTGDPTVRGSAGDDTDYNKNGFIDPEDLIFKFTDGVDDDGDGYADNISGWDTFEDDNDPFDEVQYSHGTGEARDSNAEANNGGDVGTCPDCRIMSLRVGNSFVADVNDFAQAVVFATDTGATLIQSALGTMNNSKFAQQAIDYAYKRGVVLIASAADESAGHHNQPSELEHAAVMNGVSGPPLPISASGSYLQFLGCTNYGAYVTASVPAVKCSSAAVGFSSGMVGMAYAAARNAVAKNQLQDYGVLDGPGNVPVGNGLSAEEAKQLIGTTADDIDNITVDPTTGYVNKEGDTDTATPETQRYPATKGWDPFFGYGRINANTMVKAVDAGKIPPEADISSPKWYATLPTSGPIVVQGTVAARRAASYDVSLEWAPWSWRDTNAAPAYRTTGVTLNPAINGTQPFSGTLGIISPSAVAAALDAADTSAPSGATGTGHSGPAVDPVTGRADHENRQLPDKFGVILRLVVTAKDAGGTPLTAFGGGRLVGVSTKNFNLHDDPALVAGFPKDLQGDGAAAPRFADLNDDGKDDLIVGTSNGLVHAYQSDGSELPGWPVHTTPMPTNALPSAKWLQSGEISTPLYSAVLRSPAIGDLDRDGHLEVIIPDFAGRITAVDRFGQTLPGFPVRTDPRYSTPQPDDRAAGWYAGHPQAVPGNYPRGAEPLPNNPDLVPDLVNRRTKANRTVWWALAAPALGDIDPSVPGLEIIEGAADRQVYAWHADGSPVTGWPVLLRDPTKTAAVDPYTREVTQTAADHVYDGGEIVTSPAVGDLDQDGSLEVVITPNEEYSETPDTDDPNVLVAGAALDPGNDRLYALYGDGAAHGAGPGAPANGHPNVNAYLPGWPAKLSTANLETLPVVGDGPTGSPVLGNADTSDPDLEIAAFGTAGPVHLLKRTGEPVYGRDPLNRQHTMQSDGVGGQSNSPDHPSIPSAGGGIFTDLNKDGQLDFAVPSVGLGKLLDLVGPDDQTLSDNHLSVYDTSTGTQLQAFPREVNDLQFLSTPASADLNGDGLEEILEGSAYSDLHAFNMAGEEPGLHTLSPRGWPKFTGGWTVVAPAVGDFFGNDGRVVASTTREGSLFVWQTDDLVPRLPMIQGKKACDLASWREWGHDGWNTGDVETDAIRPARVNNFVAIAESGGAHLTFTAVGDDTRCGTAAQYDVRVSDQPITDATWATATPVAGEPAPQAPGTSEGFSVALPVGARYAAIKVLDADPGTATPAHPANISALASAPIDGLAPPSPSPSPSPSPTGGGSTGGGGGGGSTGATTSPTPSPSPSVSATPTPSASPTTAPAESGFHAMTPIRLLDTRQEPPPVTAGNDRLVQVTGRVGVPPSGVTAVVVNATLTTVTGNLDLEVYPSGRKPSPRTSNLNAVRGQTVANLVTVAVGPDGKIGLSVSASSADVVLDVLGWYGDGGEGQAGVTPTRVFDSRDSTRIQAGRDQVVSLAGPVPTGASAAIVSLTALGSSGAADVELYAAGAKPSRRTSNVNVRSGETRANLAVVPVDGQQRIGVSVSEGSVQVVLDVVGYYGAGSAQRFAPLTPARTYDTRANNTPLRAGSDRDVRVLGLGGVPTSGVDSVLVNVTSVGSTAAADLQVYPTGARPVRRTSNLNVRPGQVVPVLVLAKVGRDGQISLSTSQGQMQVVLDVVGWVSSAQ